MNFKLLPLIAFLSLPVWAEKFPLGTGGDAVVCRNSSGKIISAESLDLYEGRVNRSIPHVPYSEHTNSEFFELLYKKIEVLFPRDRDSKWFVEKGEKIDSAIADFLQTGESKDLDFLFTNDQLTDHPDYSQVAPNKGCKIEQALLMTHPTLPRDPSYLIRGEIISAMTPEDIRGLVLNVLLVQFVEELNVRRGRQLDSATARYLLQKLTSVKLENLNIKYFFLSFSKIIDSIQIKDKTFYFSGFQEKLIEDHLFYYGIYVLNDDGSVNAPLTLKHGSASLDLSYSGKVSAGTSCGQRNCSIQLPKGGTISVTHEDGTKYETTISDSKYAGTGFNYKKFRPGLVTVQAVIPSQLNITLGIFTKPFDHGEITFAGSLILDSIKANGRMNQVTVRIGLNEENEWAVLKQ